MTVYLELTRAFNAGRLRAVICSGQAVVLHRVAVTSKDGDWILREDVEALDHVLGVLARHGARYRFGAPLDVRWSAGGWSSHLEFSRPDLRVRTDFFTRPPPVSVSALERMWREQEGRDPPCTDVRILAEMKKTERQRDYPVIVELARRMTTPRDQLLYSRSAEDLMEVVRSQPALALEVTRERPLLARVGSDRRALAVALQIEMLDLMEIAQRRLSSHREAASQWATQWSELSRELDPLPLPEAHARMVARAQGVLPFRVPEAVP